MGLKNLKVKKNYNDSANTCIHTVYISAGNRSNPREGSMIPPAF